VIASGATYKRLDCPELPAFEGTSVHYWASPIEAKLCAGQEVALVGGGNSAGQAVVYLASQVRKGLDAVPRAEPLEEHVGLPGRAHRGPAQRRGADEYRGLQARGRARDSSRRSAGARASSSAETRREIRHLFLLIGAEPNTSWLDESDVERDAKGFIRTDFGDGRPALQTSRDGVFAIGDVRAGSTKRVAAAVGEGAQVIAAIHQFLAQTGDRAPALGVAGGANA
jgi:thioredoxin reductase (NADPH)